MYPAPPVTSTLGLVSEDILDNVVNKRFGIGSESQLEKGVVSSERSIVGHKENIFIPSF